MPSSLSHGLGTVHVLSVPFKGFLSTALQGEKTESKLEGLISPWDGMVGPWDGVIGPWDGVRS